MYRKNLKNFGMTNSLEDFAILNSSGIYLHKVKNRNTSTRCEICSKLTIKIPERRYSQIRIEYGDTLYPSVFCPNAGMASF